MKKHLLLVSALLFGAVLALQAQAPQAIQYQTIIRNATGEVVMNQQVGIQLTILRGPLDPGPGTAVYQETHSASTNAFGLVNLQIGTGDTGGTLNDFSGVDWSMGPYFLEVGLDLTGGSSYTVMGRTQLLSVPYALYAETAGDGVPEGGDPGQVLSTDGSGNYSWVENETTYAVGDFAQGGVVFYVDASGKHGLVADIVDISGTFQWSNEFEVTGATGNGIGAGEMNTALIIASTPDFNSVAKSCANLNKGGYGDWYLPSKEELNLMYQNKATINATATANGGSSFVDSGFYWSSTEVDNGDVWFQGFNDGFQLNVSKGNFELVRAVRAF